MSVEIKSKYLPIFNVTFSRNDHFTRQEGILDSTHKILVTNASPDRTSSYVLYGLGGAGKTQIAIEYLYRHHNYFDIIHWMPANNYNAFLLSYLQVYNEPSMQALTNLNLDKERDPNPRVNRTGSFPWKTHGH